jgi:hypothetical protein
VVRYSFVNAQWRQQRQQVLNRVESIELLHAKTIRMLQKNLKKSDVTIKIVVETAFCI